MRYCDYHIKKNALSTKSYLFIIYNLDYLDHYTELVFAVAILLSIEITS